MLTGQPTDDAVIALALLYCDNSSMKVTVLLPKKKDTVSETDLKYNNFKTIIQSNSNVTVKTIASVATADLVLVEMSVVTYDLVITAFLEPAAKPDVETEDDPCPELGTLGSKIYQANVSTSLLMVVHDARTKSVDSGSNDVDIENGIELTGLNEK